jgi:hypothetical protein
MALAMARRIAPRRNVSAINAAAMARRSAAPILKSPCGQSRSRHGCRELLDKRARAEALWRRTVAWTFSTGDDAALVRSRISSTSRSTRDERSPGSLAFIGS